MPGAAAPLILGGLGVGSGVYGRMQEQNKAQSQQQKQSALMADYLKPKNIGSQAFGQFNGNPQENAARLAAGLAGLGNPALLDNLVQDQVKGAYAPPPEPKVYKKDEIVVDPVTGEVIRDFRPPPAPETDPNKVGFAQWQAANPGKNALEYVRLWSSAGRAPEEADKQFDPTDPQILRKEQDNFRAEFKPATQELQQTQSQHTILKNLLKQGTALSVTYAIKALERAFEPGAIVRPQDIEAINNAQGLIAQLEAKRMQYKNGIPASDPLRLQIEQAADSLLASKQKSYNDYVSTYSAILESRNINLKDVAPLLTLPGPTDAGPSSPGYDFGKAALGDGWSDIGNGVRIRPVGGR
jgi:hypothetical protein